MKKIMIVLISITISKTLLSQETITRKLDEVVTTYAKYNKFNGSVLVARQGKILFEKGYGFKNVKGRTLNDPHTIFLIGSITKEFTASVILRLAQEGKLALTDPVDKYFPDFPKGDIITIKDLLSQTSGIFNYTETPDFWTQSGLPTNEQNLLDTIGKRPLLFPPGEKFSYSNSNYVLLACIIQKVTGQAYEKAVRERIFAPLHMSQSGFDFTNLKDPDKSTGYWNFSPAKMVEGPVYDSSEFIGSGDVYSTVEDLYKWHVALQEGKILGKPVQEQAYQPRKGPYGYGWELDTLYGKTIVGHGGRMFGFESKMIRIPADDVFVILLNNNSDGPFLHLISQELLAVLYDRPYTLPEQPLSLTEQELKAFAGTYAVDKEHTFEVKLINGHLFGMESPEHIFELHPLKNDRFRFMGHEGEEGTLAFTRDKKGKVTAFTTVSPRGIQFTVTKLK